VSDEIQQNRYDQLLRRVAGIIGPGSKVSQVITELFPMIDVENVPSELLALSNTALAFRSTNITAAAGLSNASQLANPDGSGKIITVTQILISINTTTVATLTLANPLLANSNGFGELRDSRTGQPGGGTAVGNTRIETGAVVNAGLQMRIETNLAYSLRDNNDIAILLPGDQLTIGISAVALNLIVGYFWRERVAERSELS